MKEFVRTPPKEIKILNTQVKLILYIVLILYIFNNFTEIEPNWYTKVINQTV